MPFLSYMNISRLWLVCLANLLKDDVWSRFFCFGVLDQVSNTQAAYGPWGHFVRPAMLFDNFQIINIYIIDIIIYSLLFNSVRIVSEQYRNERTVQTARNDLPITHFFLQDPFIIFSFYWITLKILVCSGHISALMQKKMSYRQSA